MLTLIYKFGYRLIRARWMWQWRIGNLLVSCTMKRVEQCPHCGAGRYGPDDF